jgi:very-short-patch-repair endonuclease/KaiC/GvpD/RAD55 family RecA-like ATPase
MTPLQNLFYYIRDLYNSSDTCFDFEKDKNNPKSKNVNFWEVGELLTLAKKCEQKNMAEFSLAINNNLNPLDFLLKLRRISIPDEPKQPKELENWIEINRSNEIPILTIKQEIETVEKFEQSNQRINDLEKYKEQRLTSLFDLSLPNSLVDWIDLTDNKFLRKPELKVKIVLADNPTLSNLANNFQREFSEFYQKFELPFKTNRIYDALHTLHYELKGKDNKRIYISFGLVCGKIGNQDYKNFLFNVPLKLTLKSQEFKLEFDTFSSKIFCEQFFVELLDNHFQNENQLIIEERKKDVLLNIDSFNSQQREFIFESDFIRTEYFDKGLEILSVFTKKQYAFFNEETLNYSFQKTPIENQLTFSFSPIIQTKIVESKLAISKDANNIINKINELQASGKLQLIPDFFKKLFSIDGLEIEIETQSNTNQFQNNESKSQSADFGEVKHRSLFPLPYNEEQFEIAKRLNEQDAVTVKGPPGTGKSHTIANLISHFVAQGKSILVVSHNAKALSVLKDKLPIGIQELAVSLVNEGKGNESLKGSVNAIIRNLAQRYEETKVTELERQLTNLESNYANTLNQIYKAVQANTLTLKIFNPITNGLENKSAYDWAVYHFEQTNYENQLLKDTVSYETETNGIAEKLVDLVAIGNNLKRDDFDLINFQFLNDNAFIDLNEIRTYDIKLKEINEKINPLDYTNIPTNSIDENLKNIILNYENIFRKFKINIIAEQVYKHPNFRLDVLVNIINENDGLRKQIEVANNKLLSYEVDLSAVQDTDADILHQQINQVIVKFGQNKTLNWFTKSTLEKPFKRFFECKLNFNPVTEIDQFKILEIEINRLKCLKQLSITFNKYLNSFGITKQNNIQETLKELDFTVEFAKEIIEFNSQLKTRNLPQVSITSDDLTEKISYIKNVNYYAEFVSISTFLQETKQKLITHSKPHPIIYKIADAIENTDRSSYELYLDEYRKCREKQSQSLAFEKLLNEISKTLPQTALFVKNKCLIDDQYTIDKKIIELDIFNLKLNDFLNFVTSQTNGSEKLLANLQTLKRSIEKQTAETISYKTWYHKSKKVSDTQKAALNAWLNDLINIGKGYGKNTARNIASAITNMQVAKGAVPIWIMPQDTAVTFFPDASPEQFDLLIIDEASQCDISSLNLVFRCKKCLIVGDENQTSVVADRSLFTIDRTNELLDKYLISHRFKTQFDVNNKNNSIYTISGVIYPNIVTLTEHFRCLPEIIGYSNKYVYNSDIVPLKTATEKTFGEPIEIHYVEDNLDDEYKPLIVHKVIEEIENYISQFQAQEIKRLPTIGILTLDSSNIKHQNQLIRQISQNELIKQFEDKLELLIGTSREFQGDERDIMYMTITASHSIVEKENRFEIKPPRAAATEEYMRIFNVAASRAKEKSVVIHSIHPDAVGIMNHDCYRKKLIDYYSNIQNQTNKPTSTKNLQSLLNKTDANSGDFEKSVCKLLYNNGFGDYLYPQFEVGKYCIDFGLIINNKKIAIECDGFTYHSGIVKIQEDINRQLILERAGWRFFRIQSTDWFYKNSKVSSDLIQWITDNTTE